MPCPRKKTAARRLLWYMGTVVLTRGFPLPARAKKTRDICQRHIRMGQPNLLRICLFNFLLMNAHRVQLHDSSQVSHHFSGWFYLSALSYLYYPKNYSSVNDKSLI